MMKPSVPLHPRAIRSLLMLATLSSAAQAALGASVSPVSDDRQLPDASIQTSGGSTQAPAQAAAVTPSTWLVALEFATADDAEAFRELTARVEALPQPDARGVARAFLQQRFAIDGDDHIVAHFPSADARQKGRPDRTVSLSEALMGAFPDHARYSVLAEASDLVGGLNSGGAASPSVVQFGEQLAHADDGKAVFASIGRFLLSRTGPGYLYNTFFAKGNVIETVGEDHRALDEAFGIYRTGGFTKAYESPLRLSQLVEAFKAPGTFAELPYVSKLNGELDAYRKANKADWPVLARYQFVLRARLARDAGQLSQAQYELVMRGGAPLVPLEGPVSMAQLRRSAPPRGVDVRRFDINGYTASNLVRFIATDRSEVMYVPGRTPAFVVAANEPALRRRVVEQAGDPKTMDLLLSHFSLRDGQDGVFWTGVRHGLEHLGDGSWKADANSIDHRIAVISDDIFEDMRVVTEARMRDDAKLPVSTAWEGWRATINRTATLLAPIGLVRPMVVPVQVALGVVQTGTGIEQAIDGRSLEERKSGLEQAGMTVATTLALGGAFGHSAERPVEESALPSPRRPPSFVPPTRVNGRLGYAMSPRRAPGFPTREVRRLYRGRAGQLVRWEPSTLVTHTFKNRPRHATPLGPLGPGLFGRGEERFATLRGGRTARVGMDGNGYRILLKDGSAGPRIVKDRDNYWDLAFTDDNYVKGSVLAQLVDESYTVYPEALHRAAEILEQFGSSEADLLSSPLREMGPLTRLALGQGIIETLPVRLRSSHDFLWSTREVALIAPVMARQVGRSMALYGEDGSFQFAVLADGRDCQAAQVPSSALRLRRYGDSYVSFEDYRPEMPPPRRTIFRIVGFETNKIKPLWENDFRENLATAIEARSTSLELERMHKQWIDPLALPDGQHELLKELSRLRHATFDKLLPLSADQVEQLRQADKILRDALFPGEPSSLPDFDTLMLKVADPDRLTPPDTDHLSHLLADIADKHDALLPQGLRHLLVEDAITSTQAATPAIDQWTEGGRHYVRLRHLDGRSQVVETSAPQAGEREILAPGEGLDRGTGRYLVERDGRWFPEEYLREGFALMAPVLEAGERVTIDATLPVTAGQAQLTGYMIDNIPQPLLRIFGTSLPSSDIAENGAVRVIIRDPLWGRSLGFSTQRDVDGAMIAYETPGVVFPATVGSAPRDAHLVMPVRELPPRKETVPVADGGPDRASYLGMLHGEQPASAFIEVGYADRHLKTLIETRRLRGMLREDTNIALVGATPEHTFTMVMPVSAETIGLVSSGVRIGRLVSELPAGTTIVDALYGVRASVADYPSRIRAIADRWEAEGVQMKRIGVDGKEARESPVDFTERLLAAPVRPNLWNPERDPISEVRYVEYMHRRYTFSGPVSHAGLDWLETRQARRDYMSYFAPPYDVMPKWTTPLPTDSPAVVRMHELAEIALYTGALPFGPIGPFF